MGEAFDTFISQMQRQEQEGDYGSHIPAHDAAVIGQFYNVTGSSVRGLNDIQFVHKLALRTFTEYCGGEGYARRAEGPYSISAQQGFTNWRDAGVKDLLAEQGYTWMEQEGRFEEEVSGEPLEKARRTILESMVFRGEEWLAQTDVNFQPPYGDRTNLRVNLMPYAHKVEELRSYFIGEIVRSAARRVRGRNVA